MEIIETKKMIAKQVGYLQDLHSKIVSVGEVVLTKEDESTIEQITQTVNSLKLYIYVGDTPVKELACDEA